MEDLTHTQPGPPRPCALFTVSEVADRIRSIRWALSKTHSTLRDPVLRRTSDLARGTLEPHTPEPGALPMISASPHRVGLLVGRERSFPDALVAEINTRDSGVAAEYVRIGHTRIDDAKRYDVIVDRISHEVTYYQTFLKRAALEGTYVVNNPFWRIAD